MCRLYLLFFIYFLVLNSNAQEYSDVKFIDGIGALYELSSGDIDGDGDEDVIFASHSFTNIYVLFNINGVLSRTPTAVFNEILPNKGFTYEAILAIADFDNDKKQEIIFYDNASVSSSSRLSIYKYDGEKFIKLKLFDTPNVRASSMVAKDFNHDGNVDIVFVATQIYYYESNLSGEYTLNSIPATGLPYRCYSSDLNNDSWDDLIVKSNGDFKIHIYRNNQGVLDYQSSLDTQVGNVRKILISDMTGEGLKDLVVKDWDGDYLEIFTQNIDESFTRASITTTATRGWGIDLLDSNNDGQMDLIMNGYSYNEAGFIILQNDKGTFSESFYSEPMIAGLDIKAVDLNNDLTKDVLVLNPTKNILIYDHLSTDLTYKDNIPLSYFQGKFVTADVNRDGKMDVVISNFWGGSVSFHLQKDDGKLSEPSYYFIRQGAVVDMETGDFNSDGYPDFALSIQDQSISTGLLLSKGDGTYQEPFELTQPFFPTRNLIVTDFNNDGKLDLYDGALLNFGDGAGRFSRPFSNVQSHFPYPYLSGDFNGDTYADLLVSSESELSFYWGANSMSLNKGPVMMLSKSIDKIFSIHGNYDNKLDMLVRYEDGSFSKFINSGSGSFIEKELQLKIDNAFRIEISDINNDSLSDIVVASDPAPPPLPTEDIIFYLASEDEYTLGKSYTLPYSYGPFIFTRLNDDFLPDIVLTGSPMAAMLSKPIEPNEPTQSTAILISSVDDKSCKFSLARGNGNGRLVIARKAADIQELPVDNKRYLPNQTFKTGSKLGTTSFAVMDSDEKNGTLMGLTEGVEYVLSVFEYSTNNYGAINFLTTTFSSVTFKTKQHQQITTPSINAKDLTDVDFKIQGVTSSGLEVKIEKVSGDVILDGSYVHIVGPGPVKIKMTQGGNEFYLPANEVFLEFCVVPSKPIIDFSFLSGKLTLTSSSEKNNYWYLNGVVIPDAIQKQFQPAVDGIYSVTVDYSGCKSTSDPTGNIVTGLEAESVSSSPNPFTKFLNISIPASEILREVTIFNAPGQIMNFSYKRLSNVMEVDMNDAASGFYYFLILTDSGLYIAKGIKQ
jgi:hypothetical protein